MNVLQHLRCSGTGSNETSTVFCGATHVCFSKINKSNTCFFKATYSENMASTHISYFVQLHATKSYTMHL